MNHTVRALPLALASLLLGGVVVGCGGGNLASTVATPPEFEPVEGKCGVKKSEARPLIVEWPASDRAALEARVQRGVVPVRYEGCEMEVLTRCEVPATEYEYTGITRKDDRIAIRDADELYANIPVYAANFESKLERAGMLNVGMTIVGRYDAGGGPVSADALSGDCDGATHVVTAITVGAFEFYAGAEAEAGAGVHIAGAGAGAKSTSSRETLNRDGDENRCNDASPGDGAPPFGCGALIRIEVVPLGASTGASQVTAKAPAASEAPKAPPTAAPAPPPKPAAPAPPKPGPVSTAKSCKLGDEAGCTTQCEAGNEASCATLSRMTRDKKQYARALTLAQGACSAGAMLGCVIQAEMLFQGQGVKRDSAAARPLLEAACEGGEPMGCNDLGLYHQQVSHDDAEAAKHFSRACNRDTALGCMNLGFLVRAGRGVAKDAARANELFKQACSAGISPACKEAK